MKGVKGMRSYFCPACQLFIFNGTGGGVFSLGVGKIWLMKDFYLTNEDDLLLILKSTLLAAYRLTITRL